LFTRGRGTRRTACNPRGPGVLERGVPDAHATVGCGRRARARGRASLPLLHASRSPRRGREAMQCSAGMHKCRAPGQDGSHRRARGPKNDRAGWPAGFERNATSSSFTVIFAWKDARAPASFQPTPSRPVLLPVFRSCLCLARVRFGLRLVARPRGGGAPSRLAARWPCRLQVEVGRPAVLAAGRAGQVITYYVRGTHACTYVLLNYVPCRPVSIFTGVPRAASCGVRWMIQRGCMRRARPASLPCTPARPVLPTACWVLATMY